MSWNPGATAMYGYLPDEALGRYAPDLLARDPGQRRPLIEAHAAGGVSRYTETQDVHKHGRIIDVGVTASAIRDGGGRVIGIARIAHDITDRKRIEHDLQGVADHDQLTGAYSRDWLLGRLDRQLRYSRQYGRAGVVVVLDIDNFTTINGTLGHAAGDAQLVAVVDTLRARTGDADVVARLGSDAFAVLLLEATADDAMELVAELRSLLCERPTGPPIMASFGITTFTGTDQLTADDVLTFADIALHHAQERGGDQVSLYDSRSSAGRTWTRRIREALDESRFVLHGQPIVDLASSRVDRYELLIRMLADDGSIIPPGEFLPAAERFGLIGDIDRWVIGSGIEMALGGTRVGINLSARSIGDREILRMLREAVAGGLDPGAVCIEITETAVMTNLSVAREFAGLLNGMGFTLALDDFGTGFGSFTYLKYLPARYLKIDTDFVHDLIDNPFDQQIIRGIVNIAHSLGKLTVAEGVETPQVLELVREYGVDFAQGYLLGRPEPVAPMCIPGRILSATRPPTPSRDDEPRGQ